MRRPRLRPSALVATSAALAGAAIASSAMSDVSSAAALAPDPVPCVANEVPGTPGAGSATTLLGAPALRYEAYAPAGRPRGVMILVHGGGWVDVGTGQMEFMRNTLSPRWLGLGWATVIAGYRGCRRSIDDVLALYDAVRRHVGPATPIGISGESAGGHLALITAAERPDVAVVIARAAPTSAEHLGIEPAFDSKTGAADGTQPRRLAAGWRGVFGDEWLTRFNPLHRVGQIEARVLLAQSGWDPIIPVGQLFRMRDALRAGRPGKWSAAVLLAGGEPFPHVPQASSLVDYERMEREAIEPWQTGMPRTPRTVPGWWADTSPLWRGSSANPGTGRQCVPAPVLTRLQERGRARLRLAGRGMPGAPVLVTIGGRTRSVPVSRTGTFEVVLPAPAEPRRVTVAQRIASATRERVHDLRGPTVRSTRGGSVTVRHTTAGTVTLTVIDPHGCVRERRAVQLGPGRTAVVPLRPEPGSLVLAAAAGQPGPARSVTAARALH